LTGDVARRTLLSEDAAVKNLVRCKATGDGTIVICDQVFLGDTISFDSHHTLINDIGGTILNRDASFCVAVSFPRGWKGVTSDLKRIWQPSCPEGMNSKREHRKCGTNG